MINVDNSSSEKLTIPRNIGKLKLYSKLLVYGVGGLAIFAPFVVRIYNLEPTTAIFVHGSIWLTSIIYPGIGDIELGIWTFSLLGAETLTFHILLSGIRILFAYDIIHYSITEKHTKRTVIIGLLAVMLPFLYFSIPSLPDVYGWTAPVEISQVLPIPILVIGGLLILRYISPVIEEYRATLLTSKKPQKGWDEHISVPIIYTVISRIKNFKRKRQKSEDS